MVLLYYEQISDVRLLEYGAMNKCPQNRPKSLPKRLPNPFKIDAENALFSNIVFFRFRPRFGRVLGLQLGGMFAMLASKISSSGRRGQLLDPSWTLLGASSSNFGSQGLPEPRFLRVWGRSPEVLRPTRRCFFF